MKEKDELQVVHDLTFSGGEASVRKTKGERDQKATPDTGIRSVDTDTDWEKIPKSSLVGVMMEIVTRILGLRATFATQKRIDYAPKNGRQERVPSGWSCPGTGRGIYLSAEETHIRRHPITV